MYKTKIIYVLHFATSLKVAGSVTYGSLIFFNDLILPVTEWPGGRMSL